MRPRLPAPLSEAPVPTSPRRSAARLLRGLAILLCAVLGLIALPGVSSAGAASAGGVQSTDRADDCDPAHVSAERSEVRIDDQTARVADGSDAHLVTVRLLDDVGRPVTAPSRTLSVAGPAGMGGTVFAAGDVPGEHHAAVSATRAGALDLLVSYASSADPSVPAVLLGSVVAVFAAGPPDLAASGSALTLTDGDRVVGDLSAGPPRDDQVHTATVTIVDRYGNPVPHIAVRLHLADQIDVVEGTDVVVTGADGVARVSLVTAVAGAYRVRATLNGTPVHPDRGIEATWVPGDPSPLAGRTTLDATDGVVAADGTATHRVTVTARDDLGNPVPGAEVEMQIPAELAIVAGQPQSTTGADGTASVVLVSSTPGSFPVTATVAGWPVQAGSDVRVTFGDDGLCPACSSWTVSPSTSQRVGEQFTVQVTVRDAAERPQAGTAVSFDLPPQVQAVAEGPYLTDATGTVRVGVTSLRPGTYPLRAALGGDPIGDPVEVTFAAALPSIEADGTSRFSVTAGAVPADGERTHTLLVLLRDRHANPVPDVTVQFHLPDGLSTADGGPATGRTSASGAARLAVSTTRAGTYEVTASVLGLRVRPGPVPTVTFVPTAVDPGRSTITASEVPASSTVSAPEPSYLVTVVARDGYGNPVPDLDVLLTSSRTLAPAVVTGTTGQDGRLVLTESVRGPQPAVLTVLALVEGASVRLGTLTLDHQIDGESVPDPPLTACGPSVEQVAVARPGRRGVESSAGTPATARLIILEPHRGVVLGHHEPRPL